MPENIKAHFIYTCDLCGKEQRQEWTVLDKQVPYTEPFEGWMKLVLKFSLSWNMNVNTEIICCVGCAPRVVEWIKTFPIPPNSEKPVLEWLVWPNRRTP